jgi:hypothetical protein
MTTDIIRVLAKVEKLVAMTSSPHEEEARTSAFMACKLIRNHSLQIVAYSARSHQEHKPNPPPTPEPEPNPPNEFIPIQVKHKGYCRRCGKSIYVGEMAFWRKGKGLLHFSCMEDSEP